MRRNAERPGCLGAAAERRRRLTARPDRRSEDAAGPLPLRRARRQVEARALKPRRRVDAFATSDRDVPLQRQRWRLGHRGRAADRSPDVACVGERFNSLDVTSTGPRIRRVLIVCWDLSDSRRRDWDLGRVRRFSSVGCVASRPSLAGLWRL